MSHFCYFFFACVFERTIADEPRTNNILEGWHGRFNTIIAKHHLNIYEFLEKLKGEQAHTDTLVKQLIAGQQPQQPRMKVCMIPIKSNLNSCRIKNSRIILVPKESFGL